MCIISVNFCQSQWLVATFKRQSFFAIMKNRGPALEFGNNRHYFRGLSSRFGNIQLSLDISILKWKIIIILFSNQFQLT